VANLPFNVATPILSNLLSVDHVPHTMVATIQKELADRITAQPWSKDYGALSVWLQSQCHVETVRVLPPTVFWPAPKVQSAIVRIAIDPQRRDKIPNLRYFHQFTKAIFLQRRKFLRANVVAAMKGSLGKKEVDDVLESMQFGPDTRSEQLDVPSLLALTECVRALVPSWHP
jgi:16S rRNA (adenine1518-N6/adenine1519-N6)-dimethyltransferase